MLAAQRALVSLDGLEQLFSALRGDGYELIGPSVRAGAITYGPITGVRDLPRGVGDDQRPGHYRLRERGDDAVFGYAVGPHSFKRELLVPELSLVRVRRNRDDLTFEEPVSSARKRAFIGARACELAAIAVQDRVLMGGAYADADYARRRDGLFVVAVQCTESGGTCFCASMDTGPRARSGFDLALTELLDPHEFVVEVGSEAGGAVLARVPHSAASSEAIARADTRIENTAARMGRALETDGIRELLAASHEHPRWDDVASRCLGCANCTLACPTCFCTSVEDRCDLTGTEAERVRRWDSCFTLGFSHLPGGSVRTSVRARYRQWLTHKLGTWHDQFGSSGCVGCGRCITWCPVGIDITEEAAALRAEPPEATRSG